MNRKLLSTLTTKERIPHLCGDEPGDSMTGVQIFEYSPHVGDEPLYNTAGILAFEYSPRVWG